MPVRGKLTASQQLAAFGHRLPGREALGGLDALGWSCADTDDWSRWCCGGGAAQSYGGDQRGLEVCLREFPLGWSVVGHPATWAGQLSRWTMSGLLPRLEEYEPKKLFVTAILNPGRFAFLTAVGSFVAPFLGTAYMATFVPPLALTTGWPATIGAVLATEGPGAVWDQLLEPIVVNHVELAQWVMSNGPSGAVIHGIRKEVKQWPPTILKALALAITEDQTVFEALREPSKMREAWALQKLGQTAQRLGRDVFKLDDIGKAAYAVGRAVELNSDPISILLKRGAAGLPEALDRFSERVLGIGWKQLSRLPQDAQASSIAAAKADPERREAFGFLAQVNAAVGEVSKAFTQIRLGEVGKILADVLAFLAAPIDTVTKAWDSVGTPAPSGGTPAPSGGTPAPSGGVWKTSAGRKAFLDVNLAPPSKALAPPSKALAVVGGVAVLATAGGGVWWALHRRRGSLSDVQGRRRKRVGRRG